ncbi:MAG: ribosomal protein S18-alanine N-acetyltransferase [Christensenella sp.]|uniref:ribosomal protein S18-alanine N-acetyltransferase n=1 Tax=Christensenella sp. TaxID=1935934 RepID=UPI002B20DE7B|nr:ribosomal protein S18-alanine N-acetyltransferase [Christensenella sp.]MEA5004232.1 ribosomal protein S18-alanine N-acetyltransferase [Christensenella sp.]
MESNDISIRRAQIGDLEQIHYCENTSFEFPWSYAMLYDDIIENENTVYLVVELKGQIIGYGGMWIIFDEAHITNVCILPEYRGKGYAYSLMRELIEVAKEHDADAMSLEVRVSNKAALRLYKKCGFTIHGIRKRYYSNNGEDAYVMWTERGPGLEGY